MDDQIDRIRGELPDECVVLLEELLRSNRAIAAENEKLRQEQEQDQANKSQAEVLQRIERRLNEPQNHGHPRARLKRARGARDALRNIAVPAACRRSVRKIYNVLAKKDDFDGFKLDEEVNSENNKAIFDRVVNEILHQNGGQERCPWTRAAMEAALQRYFLSCFETRRLKSSNKYEEHKRKTRKSGRQREKLTRRTSALEMRNWRNTHKKGKAAEVLLLDAMSSEESCYEDGDADSRKVVKYQVKRLSWESRKLRKIKNKLDKACKKSLTKRAQDRILVKGL